MKNLSINQLGLITSIWKEKAWAFATNEQESEKFNLFCNLMTGLAPDAQELFVKLMRSFSYYPYTKYNELLLTTLTKITSNQVDGIEQVIFVPLVKITKGSNVSPVKSGTTLVYPAKEFAKHIPHLTNKKIEALINIDELEKHFSKKSEKALIILVDDFIGTGSTVNRTIIDIKPLLRQTDRVLIMSLVAMEKGAETLSSLGLDSIVGVIERKGIESNPLILEKIKAYEIIDRIESLLDIEVNFRHGFKQSESLVSMIRTPNNTFPMFWQTKKTDGTYWPAPFPRH